jgi:hypothetical protein
MTTPKEAAGGLFVADTDMTSVRWTRLRADSLMPVALEDREERQQRAPPRPFFEELCQFVHAGSAGQMHDLVKAHRKATIVPKSAIRTTARVGMLPCGQPPAHRLVDGHPR